MKKAFTFLLIVSLMIGMAFPILGASAKYFSSGSLKGTGHDAYGLMYTKASYAKYSKRHGVRLTAKVIDRASKKTRAITAETFPVKSTKKRYIKTKYVYDRYMENDYASHSRAIAFYKSI